MTLVVGGMGQGKLAYVKQRWNLGEEDVSETLGNQRVVYKLETIIQKILIEEGDPVSVVLAHAKKHPDTIYICDEVGCGVVPVDRSERAWREAVGRCCVALAAEAERVERVFCGLPMVLKGERKER